MLKSKVLQKILVYVVLPVAVIYLLFRLNQWMGFGGILAYLAIVLVIQRSTVFTLKGKIEYGKGNLTQAVKWFGKAANGENAGTALMASYGFVLLKAGQVDESEKVLLRAVDKSKNSDERNLVKSNLALVLWKKGKLDEAIEMLTEVISEGYKTTAIYGSLGYLLIEKGDLDSALEMNLEAYEYNSENAIILDNLAHLYHLLGENEKAVELFEKLMEKKPQFPEAYFDYGQFLEGQARHDEAVELYQKALACPFNHNSTVTEGQVRECFENAERKRAKGNNLSDKNTNGNKTDISYEERNQ